MKKTMTIMGILLGIGAIAMFVLAGVLNFSLGWTIGLGNAHCGYSCRSGNRLRSPS